MLRHVVTTLGRQAIRIPTRQFSASSVVLAQQKAAATDPIQKLFVDKIKEYSQKSQASPDGLVDCTDDVRKALAAELDAVTRLYKSDFPNLPKYTDAELVEKTIEPSKVVAEAQAVEEVAAVAENPERHFMDPLQRADFI